MFTLIEFNDKLAFKINDGYQLELKTLETIKLFGSTKKIINKIKNGEYVPFTEIVEVVLI